MLFGKLISQSGFSGPRWMMRDLETLMRTVLKPDASSPRDARTYISIAKAIIPLIDKRVSFSTA